MFSTLNMKRLNKFIYILLLIPIIGFSQADTTAIKGYASTAEANKGNTVNLTPETATRVRYATKNGAGTMDGTSEANAWSIDMAFDNTYVDPGDYINIKYGEMGPYGTPSGGSTSAHYNLSNLGASASNPIAWVGYHTTPGDLDRPPNSFAAVSWSDYLAGTPEIDGTRPLDPSVMPTFSGDITVTDNKYINNGYLFYTDGGEEGYIFKNIQIQYFRRGFYTLNINHSVLNNVVQANHGWFTDVEGQGGVNTDLQGSSFFLSTGSDNNIITNCASYNVAFIAFTLNTGNNNVVSYCEAVSNINNGNPEDYYFHTIGRYNVFHNIKVDRLSDSNHSGHGICFNQGAGYNVMRDSQIKGTSIHFDGSAYSYAHDITLTAYPSYVGDGGPAYTGGGIVFQDDPYETFIENVTSLNNVGAVSAVATSDTYLNPLIPSESAVFKVTIKNSDFNGQTTESKTNTFLSLGASYSSRKELPANDMEFLNCRFTEYDVFTNIYCVNNGINVKNSCFDTVLDFTVPNDIYSLDSGSILTNNNFNGSEIPTGFSISGTTTLVDCPYDSGSTPIDVTGISWDSDVQSVTVGGYLDLSHTFAPTNATNQGFSLLSSNTSVVSNTGAVIGPGTATLTITTDDGGFTDIMSITVNDAPTEPTPSGGRISAGKFILINY